MDATFDAYLKPTPIIDSDHPRIVAYAQAAVAGAGEEPVAKAVRLYYGVRDAIWYDPYLPFDKPEHYRASSVLERRRAFCIGKATLLCALGRASGIPARVGFADVRNHLATRQLREFMGSDVFVFHGYTEFYLEGRWVKATPAFNIELCRKHRVAPLEFNGREDSVFHPFNQDSRLFMESPWGGLFRPVSKPTASNASGNGSSGTRRRPANPTVILNTKMCSSTSRLLKLNTKDRLRKTAPRGGFPSNSQSGSSRSRVPVRWRAP